MATVSAEHLLLRQHTEQGLGRGRPGSYPSCVLRELLYLSEGEVDLHRSSRHCPSALRCVDSKPN